MKKVNDNKITNWILKLLINPSIIFIAVILTLFSLPPIAGKGLFIAGLLSFAIIEWLDLDKKYWWIPILISLYIGFQVNI